MSAGSDHRSRRGRGLISDSDLRLWQQITRSATPLAGNHPSTETPPDPPVPRAVAPPRCPTPAASPAPTAPRERPDSPRHDGAGIDRRTYDRFRRGRMALDGRLDLHGMTRERAHQALTVFLHRAHERGARCVLVVTGKGTGREGGGVLRRDVPLWLGQGGVRRIVLSTAPAQARDGGDGALYVLLRRRRDSAQTLGRTSSS
ncbi:Smr/MutS family protein [Rhodospira trueperi]|nr:Smr/MutS family protein [Rhodospira trueperi]